MKLKAFNTVQCSVSHTCSDVPAPMSRPSDWATKQVWVDNVMNMKKRRKSFGWLVIQ